MVLLSWRLLQPRWRRLHRLNHTRLNTITVLTGSHSSGRGNRTARQWLAPPAMLRAEPQENGTKERPAHLCGSSCFFQFSCFFSFSFFNIPIASSSHIEMLLLWCLFLCCWDQCVIFESLHPASPRFDFIVCFGLNLEKCGAKSCFALNSCEFSLKLCISVTSVSVCVCACVRVSDCVVQ